MAFVVRVTWIIFSALTYEIITGNLHGSQLDPYQISALPTPSDAYGFPAEDFVAPPVDYGESINYYGMHSPELGHTISENGNLTPPPAATFYRIPSNYQSNNLNFRSDFQNGIPRFVGETFRVGKPLVSSSKVVYKNVVKKVPVEVTRHIEVDVAQPFPVPVRQEIRVPVPEAYPVISGEIIRNVPYTVYKTQSYEVERRVPYEVVREVPYPVIKKVKVKINKPFTVWKKVHVPVKKHVDVPVTLWKPYPVDLIKHVMHYKTKNCCW